MSVSLANQLGGSATRNATGPAYRFIQLCLGALLLIAAYLKGTSPALATDFLSSPLAHVTAVQVELFLGVWLISGCFAKASWYATVVCFFGFSLISAYKIGIGEETCGCFGTLSISPWWSLLIDLTALGSLLSFRPAANQLPYHVPLVEAMPEGSLGARKNVWR